MMCQCLFLSYDKCITLWWMLMVREADVCVVWRDLWKNSTFCSILRESKTALNNKVWFFFNKVQRRKQPIHFLYKQTNKTHKKQSGKWHINKAQQEIAQQKLSYSLLTQRAELANASHSLFKYID